jgi:SPP1 family phage portal protein
MYLTPTDQAILMMQNNFNMDLSDTIAELIHDDHEKIKKRKMDEGDNYYHIRQDILKKNYNEVTIDGIKTTNPLISNEKLVHAFHRILVDQKISRAVGNPVKIIADEQLLKKINGLLGDKFDLLMQNWGIGASNKGAESLHPYINKHGKFDLAIIPEQQLIYIYDSSFQKEQLGVLRYYTVTKKLTRFSTPITTLKVEIWNKDYASYLVENESGKFIADPDKKPNPQPHFYEFNTIDPDNKKGRSWGRSPFIKLRNNVIEMSDLEIYKTLIDNYDNSRSTMSNNLQDIQEMFWLLFGAEDTNLGEFVRNLKTYKAMKVPLGTEVENKKGEVPFESRKEHEDKLWEDIFFFGMGVNWKSDSFRNPPSGKALKTMLIPLDLKTNALIREWTSSLQELMGFCCDYLSLIGEGNYNPKDITFQFDKQAIIDDLEQSQIAQNSKGIISDETIQEHHPWVKDIQLEQERMKKQNENQPYDFSKIGV